VIHSGDFKLYADKGLKLCSIPSTTSKASKVSEKASCLNKKQAIQAMPRISMQAMPQCKLRLNASHTSTQAMPQ